MKGRNELKSSSEECQQLVQYLKKGSQVHYTPPDTCTYPRSPALGLGLGAAVALMIAQVIINVAAGCICCKRNSQYSNSNWTLSLVYFVVSWFTFVIAFLLLLTGAALNDQHGEESMYFGNYCYVVKPGVFAGGAVLSLSSITLGILYYLTLSSAENRMQWGATPYPNQGGIAMGPPPSSQPPVFVPEDTYTRRQFP
ncbi:protein MODIFYING WALL LIGNIN-2 isoform X2 [Macadamia integrifolia]|uniref:protein MODIFYING WALL LIGNIN-2 isoform X2 n=1 Tax=Macadamia integrifolia TaxID=60698 RepID=UPI001C4F883A|nr:protein MODIFYING WALL LIGNIN-2 isoform X2 [Macadamia integrifolia]